MFANKLHIKQSINTCQKLGRLNNTWAHGSMGRFAPYIVARLVYRFTLYFMLRYIENHRPVKLYYTMQSLSEKLSVDPQLMAKDLWYTQV